MWSLGDLTYRITITCVNIIFPPLAVCIIAGPGYDCLMNCFLFLLAIIPAHVHGFYVSCVYFHRRHKVKKGQYPGGPKTFIGSKDVLNGGASNKEVERLYMKEKGIGRAPSRRGSKGRHEMAQRRDGSRAPSVRSNGHRADYGPPIEYDGRVPENGSRIVRAPSGRSNASRPNHGSANYGPPIEYDDRVARDGYGTPQSTGPRKWFHRS